MKSFIRRATAAIGIAGSLTIASAAFADVSGIPLNADDLVGQPLPSQAGYFEERAASLRTATVNGDSFPPSENDIVGKPLPSQARYFEQKEANTNIVRHGNSSQGSM